jgi:hypothetical protein
MDRVAGAGMSGARESPEIQNKKGTFQRGFTASPFASDQWIVIAVAHSGSTFIWASKWMLPAR